MSERLKLCPFCGGKAELTVVGDPLKGAFIIVKCTMCGGASKGYYFRGEIPDAPPLEDSIGGEKAMNAWNRRARE